MSTVFVTASGTEIGKTFVTEMLLAQLRQRGYESAAIKPVVSGFDPDNVEDSDTGRLLRAQGAAITTANIDTVSPWRFTAALSPDMAARRERREIDFDSLLAFCRSRDERRPVLIEGVGGIMVPLDEAHTVVDWIRELAVPALLVAGSYLGSISHTLSAAFTLEQNGIEICGIVVNESEKEPVGTDETADVISRFAAGIPVVVLPRKKAGDDLTVPDLTPLVDPYMKCR